MASADSPATAQPCADSLPTILSETAPPEPAKLPQAVSRIAATSAGLQHAAQAAMYNLALACLCQTLVDGGTRGLSACCDQLVVCRTDNARVLPVSYSSELSAAAGETGAILRTALLWSDAAASLCHLLALLTSSSAPQASPSDSVVSAMDTSAEQRDRITSSRPDPEMSHQGDMPPRKRLRLAPDAAADNVLAAAWQAVVQLTDEPDAGRVKDDRQPQMTASAMTGRASSAAAVAAPSGVRTRQLMQPKPQLGHWDALAAACHLHQQASAAAAHSVAVWDRILAASASAGLDAGAEQACSPALSSAVAAAAVDCLQRAARLHQVSCSSIIVPSSCCSCAHDW